jgi:holo-[acyl-carrier protein] synthase
MPDRTALKKIVADLFQTSPDAIDASFSLRHPRLQSSAGRGALAAAIHRTLGVYCPKAFTATHYGQLEAAVFGDPNSEVPATTGSSAPLASRSVASPALSVDIPGVHLGVDIEMVDSMPDVADFWTAPFYQSHFTPAEIAYCLRQEQPRVHFAARWCAKEALAKCKPGFAGADPTTIQVRALPDGRPVLEVLNGKEPRRIDVSLSLSHTPLMAIAVVAGTPRAPA